ncbi:MAG: hypothetical protein AAF525_07895 [Pseudomonadota bacterium]
MSLWSADLKELDRIRLFRGIADYDYQVFPCPRGGIVAVVPPDDVLRIHRLSDGQEVFRFKREDPHVFPVSETRLLSWSTRLDSDGWWTLLNSIDLETQKVDGHVELRGWIAEILVASDTEIAIHLHETHADIALMDSPHRLERWRLPLGDTPSSSVPLAITLGDSAYENTKFALSLDNQLMGIFSTDFRTNSHFANVLDPLTGKVASTFDITGIGSLYRIDYFGSGLPIMVQGEDNFLVMNESGAKLNLLEGWFSRADYCVTSQMFVLRDETHVYVLDAEELQVL